MISTEASSSEPQQETSITPILNEPRPFSIESQSTLLTSTTQKPSTTTRRSTTSSSKVSDFNVRSRFRLKPNSNKNLSNKVFVGEDNSVEVGSGEITDKTRPLRTKSRFHRPELQNNEPTSHAPIRKRIRPKTTERSFTDKEEDEYQRKYRPLTLDDLSSLTAADISIQESNRGIGVRRSRLRTTTVDTLSSETTDESVTTTTKRILNRSKSSYINSKSFKRKNDILEQNINNNEEVITKQQNQNEKISISTTEPNRRIPHRTRKIIRRLRTSTVQPSTSPTPVTHRGRPFSISSLNIQNNPDSNILLSDSDSNEENYSEESGEEDENIKLSATNIRENSNTNNANVIFESDYKKSDQFFRKSPSTSKYWATTEPSFQRTRKIVRKLRPTESTFTSEKATETTSTRIESPTTNSGRNKKIIRRFRPKSVSYQQNSYDKPNEFINKASKSQFFTKRTQQFGRSKSKLPRIITSKQLATTEDLSNTESSSKLFNKFGSNIEEDHSEEIQTDVSTRGKLRYIDIVRSTLPLVMSTEIYTDYASSEDGTTSTIQPFMEESTTGNYNLKDSFTTMDYYQMNEESNHVSDVNSSEEPELSSTVTETTFSATGSFGDTTTSNILTDTADITTISQFQITNSTDGQSEEESSTIDSNYNTDTSVTDTLGTVTFSDSSDELTTVTSQRTPETTTAYLRKSTLRSAAQRPTYFIRRTTSSTTTTTPKYIKPIETFHRPLFSKRKHTFRPKSSTSLSPENTTEKLRRKYPFNKFGRTSTTSSEILTKESELIGATKSPLKSKPFIENETSVTTESYQEGTTKEYTQTTSIPKKIDSSITKSSEIEKQRLRNKALFFKQKRKMNIPTLLQTSSKEEQTTEYLTTLYHVFAEPEVSKSDSNTITKNETHINNAGNIERVVEINRIVEVHVKNGDEISTEKKENDTSILDKIGAINRVTSIKVVDGNRTIDQTNQRLTVVHDIIEQEIENERKTNHRKDRKFGIDINNNSSNKIDVDSKGPEIIDGISHIKVITPRPIQLVEPSTIALEGLFTIDSAKTEYTEDPNVENTTTATDNELLDTDYSRFVNIRVLKPDVGRSLGESLPGDTPRVVRIISNTEDVTMKAKVVEVTPKDSNQTIRISPIQVSMSRSIADVPVIGLKKLNEKISNTPFRSNFESGVP
ncbi:hypothetical protein WA026_013095 [Henosepilachna vigintioctopunctata]|uniref:Uncharacterized protein n=1 Tax=Henosepilachna vigintioctopunctata TaxID=420089 RepID=A0AAW1UCM4_9CUCU